MSGKPMTTPNPKAAVCPSAPQKVIDFMAAQGFEYTDELGKSLVANHKFFLNKATGLSFLECQATFMYRQMVQAKIDELGAVQLEYGRYVAQTYVDGQAMTVEERFDDLKAELQELEEEK